MNSRFVQTASIALLAASLLGCKGLAHRVVCPDEVWSGYCFSNAFRSCRSCRAGRFAATGGYGTCSACQNAAQDMSPPQRPIPLPPVPEDDVPPMTPAPRNIIERKSTRRAPARDNGPGYFDGTNIREAPPNVIPYTSDDGRP